MLDRTFMTRVRKAHSGISQNRRLLQSISAEILGASKRSIFATQRSDASQAKRELDAAVKLIQSGKKVVQKRKQLEHEGMWRAALEEFAEAWLYAHTMIGKPVTFVPEVSVDDSDTYIGALSDLTGELTRSCVLAATKRNVEQVERTSAIVRDVVAFLLHLDLSGQHRQKFDQAKQNLRKIEEIAFNLSLHG